MKNNHIQGFMLINTTVAALNNAGKQTGSNNDNGVATKKVYKDGKPYVYVSGQAIRNWLRLTLQKDRNWQVSPTSYDEKIAFTAADPIAYPDDDIFGYMKAAKQDDMEDDGVTVKQDKKGKNKKKDVTVTRKGPLSTSAVTSVAPVSVARAWSSMSRHIGNSVPYSKEEYGCVMQNEFALNVNLVGTFSSYSRAGFKNITEETRELALQNGCTMVEDPFTIVDGAPAKLVRLPLEERQRRITDVLCALKTLAGGAMQACNMTDVTPKFIILAQTTSANHPFGLLFTADNINENPVAVTEEAGDEKDTIPVVSSNGRVQFNPDRLREILEEYKDFFVGGIYIGRRSGFMDEHAEGLEKLAAEYANVHVGPVNKIIDEFCAQLKITA